MRDEHIYTQNRELSWLRFDRRVLEEAADGSVPALERLKFLAIFSTNLDEFFMVRVGSIFDISAVAPGDIDNKSGLTPSGQLQEIYRAMPGLIERKKQVYAQLGRELREQGIEDVDYDRLRPGEAKLVTRYYKDNILPVLSPQVVDSRHPSPKFQNKRLYVASLLRGKNGKHTIAFVPVPGSLPKLIMLPETGRFIRTENIILHFAPSLYGSFRHEESCILAVTRNADVSYHADKFEDTEMDYRDYVKGLMKKRARQAIVRLELSRTVPGSFFKYILKYINVENHQIYVDPTPLDMGYAFQLGALLPEKLRSRLSYEPYSPRWPEDLDKNASMIGQIQRQDRLLFFPFHSVEPFLRLLNEAADRPEVLGIRMTIYRLASSSRVVRALCRAAENGKEVVVLMELRARFDEENNIAWAKMLSDAGCRVIYGPEDYKCHSKVCLISMRDRGKISYITQIGTGNYNEKTNAMYTDLSLMTADERIGRDANAFFRDMLTDDLEGEYDRLLVAPKGMLPALYREIDREIDKGEKGYICMKVNSVTDRGMIDKLAQAAQAGVELKLIVRGICCIRPGVPGYTEGLEVRSIVGRYLEHARIYCFGREDDRRLYISSADLMTRNLRRRVEVACPVTDPRLTDMLLKILEIQLKDTEKASLLQPDGSYIRLKAEDEPGLDSQAWYMEHSLHPASPPPAPKPQGLWDSLRRLLGGEGGS